MLNLTDVLSNFKPKSKIITLKPVLYYSSNKHWMWKTSLYYARSETTSIDCDLTLLYTHDGIICHVEARNDHILTPEELEHIQYELEHVEHYAELLQSHVEFTSDLQMLLQQDFNLQLTSETKTHKFLGNNIREFIFTCTAENIAFEVYFCLKNISGQWHPDHLSFTQEDPKFHKSFCLLHTLRTQFPSLYQRFVDKVRLKLLLTS